MPFAIECRDGIALCDGERSYTYPELAAAVGEMADRLCNSGVKTVGIAMDNGPLWGALDLAALHAGLICVPLPGFFSPSQLAHVVQDAGIDAILTDRAEFFSGLLGDKVLDVANHKSAFGNHALIRCAATQAKVPSGTVKITYTSGTTGRPKGVCLSRQSIETVANSLLQASGATADYRYLSVLPLSTLLENIGALYVPLLAGASCILLPLNEVGLEGAAKFDAAKMVAAFEKYRANCAILTPQLLQSMLALRHPLPELRFLAVGGAPVSRRLLEQAEAQKVPVFEGYGLSECASVVSLNTVEARRIGSAGRPLPHADLKFAEDGEILVRGAVMLGYCGGEPVDGYWPTGDTGFLDEDGYLHLTGRKKSLFITSYGRNVAPEWVESELTVHPAVVQAAVFGEGRPWNVAVIVPRDVSLIDDAVRKANLALPDYARIGRWLIADKPFLPQNGQLTINGRLKRDAIWPQYRERIEALYGEEHGVLR
jgi:long-subunit acyl-CoA synthetase (AMP-forming)